MYDMTRVNAKGYFDAADSADARHETKKALNAQRTEDYRNGTYARAGGVVDPLPEDAPFFVKDYYDYYKTERGYTERSLNSNDGWNVTSSLSFLNMPILRYSNEMCIRDRDGAVLEDTQACITWLYGRMEYGCKEYPGFFTLHSLGFIGEDKSDGKRRMQQTWQHILDGLCSVLQRDAKVRPDAFTEQFTAEKFADVLFSLMLSALLRQDYNPAAVLEIVRRTLY